jgi:hypothetical protein
VRRLLESGFVRGMAFIALVSLVIVVFSLEGSLVTAAALVRVGFFLAIAFFLFLLWRDRRGDLEVWTELSRRTFYGAIVVAVVDVALLVALVPRGVDAAIGLVVLLLCGYAVIRVWRRERSLA